MWLAALACACLSQQKLVSLPNELPAFEVVSTNGEFLSDAVLNEGKYLVFFLDGQKLQDVPWLVADLREYQALTLERDWKLLTFFEGSAEAAKLLKQRVDWPGQLAAVPSEVFRYGAYRDEHLLTYYLELDAESRFHAAPVDLGWQYRFAKPVPEVVPREGGRTLPEHFPEWTKYAMEGVPDCSLLVRLDGGEWHAKLHCDAALEPGSHERGVLALDQSEAWVETWNGEKVSRALRFSESQESMMGPFQGFPASVVWRNDEGDEIARVDFLELGWTHRNPPGSFEPPAPAPQPTPLAQRRFDWQGMQVDLELIQVDLGARVLMRLENTLDHPVWIYPGSWAGSIRTSHRDLGFQADSGTEEYGWSWLSNCGNGPEPQAWLHRELVDRCQIVPGEVCYSVFEVEVMDAREGDAPNETLPIAFLRILESIPLWSSTRLARVRGSWTAQPRIMIAWSPDQGLAFGYAPSDYPKSLLPVPRFDE